SSYIDSALSGCAAVLRCLVFSFVVLSKADTNAATDGGLWIESLAGSESGGRVIQRGKDFALVRTITTTTNVDGNLRIFTNHVTLLENCLHYFSEGEWRTSRDIVEPFPGGAVASYGPNRAIFSSELFNDAVFDIETAE